MEIEKASEKTRKIWRMLAVDFSVFSAFLLIFAYFHHVRVDRLSPTDLRKSAEPVIAEPFSAPDVTPQPDAARTPEISPESAAPDLLSGRFSEKFIAGEPEITDMEYRSESVSVRVDRISENNVTYFVADIYLRDLTSFRTAVALEHIDFNRMPVLEMARLNGAVLAVSGDYFAFRKTGVLAVRNGKEWIRKDPLAYDILVLYESGEMEVFYAKEKPDIDAIYARAPYQIWCFGPVLLIGGEAPARYNSTVGKKNPRCAIGYYEPGHYCFLLADGRQSGYSVGLTFGEMTEIFESLGCELAYNLDGGDTAVMTFGDAWMSHPDGTPRNVSDIVYIAEPLKQ